MSSLIVRSSARLIASRRSAEWFNVIGTQLELFHRPRTCQENVHQPPGALLPVGAGGDVGHADQGAKQIKRVEIFSNVAALDRPLDQRANRLPDLGVRGFENF